jgi:hypothetical protein
MYLITLSSFFMCLIFCSQEFYTFWYVCLDDFLVLFLDFTLFLSVLFLKLGDFIVFLNLLSIACLELAILSLSSDLTNELEQTELNNSLVNTLLTSCISPRASKVFYDCKNFRRVLREEDKFLTLKKVKSNFQSFLDGSFGTVS